MLLRPHNFSTCNAMKQVVLESKRTLCVTRSRVCLGTGLHRRGCQRIASRCGVCEVHVHYLQIQPKGFDEGESL